MNVRVTSEIGVLERVICHPPGPELSVVTPSNRAGFLFDDLLDEEESHAEHRLFREALGRFADVRDVLDLLADVLETPEGREFVMARADEGLRARAEDLDATGLARLFVQGQRAELARPRGESLAELLNEAGYLLPPLPNLFFTRDAACVIGGRAAISAMAHAVRWTEALIMRALFTYHPLLTHDGLVYDGASERRFNTSIEGGDVHVLRPDLLLIGLSERTSAYGIGSLAETLFAESDIDDVIVVLLPRERAAIHLDMIFTMLDRELCCVFPPHFQGPTRLPVLHVSRGRESIEERADLFAALAAVDCRLEPIFCGGARRAQQEREQWGSACNMFAVAPGHVFAYARNDQTLAALQRDGGFTVLPAQEVAAGGRLPEPGDRTVVTFRGSELVRGGGGPRCMTLPVRSPGSGSRVVDPRSGDPEVRFAPDGVLIDRAMDLLAEAPRPSAVLAEEVLGIRGGPPALAERLVASLFADERRVLHGADGLWRVEARPRRGDDRGLDRLRYAVVDVETTGGIAGQGGRIIEIAIVHVDRGDVVDSFSTLIDAGVSIPPFISRLTGIRTEMTTGAPRFSEVLEEVRDRLRGRVFVAHSAGYDWGFVRSEMRRAGATPPRGPRLCTVHLARRLLPGLERRGLDSVAGYYGIEIHDRHRAQGDAIATARVLVRMLADAQRKGWTTWEELRRALAKAPPRRKRRRAISPPLPHEREAGGDR